LRDRARPFSPVGLALRSRGDLFRAYMEAMSNQEAVPGVSPVSAADINRVVAMVSLFAGVTTSRSEAAGPRWIGPVQYELAERSVRSICELG